MGVYIVLNNSCFFLHNALLKGKLALFCNLILYSLNGTQHRLRQYNDETHKGLNDTILHTQRLRRQAGLGHLLSCPTSLNVCCPIIVHR